MRRIRYAVLGAGHIAQAAVLPAFENVKASCELVALVSGGAEKRDALVRRYHLPFAGSYDELERILADGRIDAVYIATANSMHRSLTERAARCGVHVLCEKPMAVTVDDCEAMVHVAREHRVKLMIAYRLHFEEANLRAIDLLLSGEIGKSRVFTSVFSQQVRPGDIRTQGALGGGAMLDMGVYPINAARYLFRDEPVEVFAFTPPVVDPRFNGVDETTSIMLRFPRGRVAQMTVSLGAAASDSYRVIGTEGELRVEPAFGYDTALTHHLTKHGRTTEVSYGKRDQFGPELLYFARCILEDREPEPSGEEGLADVRIANAALESTQTGRSVSLPFFTRAQRPDLRQEIHKPAIKTPKVIDALASTLR